MVHLQPSAQTNVIVTNENLREVVYPDSDGQPMADNTKQFEWIVLIKKNLDLLFINDPHVFVAGDLLWYPVEGNPKIRIAPDALVVFGRPKEERGSYQQWQEENIPPQVVFEILSPGNTALEMERKLLFYERYGVEEYYLYDPAQNLCRGWLRVDGYFDEIATIDQWISPRLGIRFDLTQDVLQLYRPDGVIFQSYTEIAQQLEQERQAKEQALHKLAETEAKADRLADRLRELGIDPHQI
ncbi:Uma2 family endonuclease [Alkalinema pantanalense CENA528]|uniref:Uma2 family endonuclease n=1 Tax=Alkalinema pantanalense TaxID=1620705 RepID=UPI003D6F0659